MAQQQLSGTIVVIIIAVGVQACIIVFIFLKRQVQRLVTIISPSGQNNDVSNTTTSNKLKLPSTLVKPALELINIQ